MLVALWRFLALHYSVGHDFRTDGDHWGSGSLKGVMRAPLYVLVVYRAFSCSLLFKACHPYTPLYYYICFIVFSLFTQEVFLMARLQVGWALGCFGCLG